MQHVNDDMDELFRRAGEHYPLDTSGADWNKVLNALQNSGDKKETASGSKSRLLWLLLLLPLGFLCNRLYSPGISSNGQVAANKNQHTGSTSGNKDARVNAGTSTLPGKENSVQKMNGDQKSAPEQTAQVPTQTAQVPTRNSASSSNPKSTTSFVKSAVRVRNGNTAVTNRANGSGHTKVTLGTPSVDEVSSGDHSFTGCAFYTSNLSFGHSYRMDLLRPAYSFAKELLPVVNTNNEQKKNPTSAKTKRFYVGALGGMDVTTVKFQKVEDKGNNYGFVAGYQLNQKWAVEAGAFWERKYYYSDGKYFNLKGMYLPPNTKVTEVSGNCKMIEIPVNVRYNFSRSWFAKTGVSSYLMENEDYKYVYYYGNSGTYANHYKNYTTNSTSVFSHITVAGGYQHRLGRLAEIRVEPYVKIPIKKMGVGDLPLFSSGVHLGLIRRF